MNKREFIKDVLVDIDNLSLYNLGKKLNNLDDEITRELGVGINRYISANLEVHDGEPKLVLSVYKSEGGF